MKTHVSLIVILIGAMVFLIRYSAWSQAPQSFKYQAVVRDKSGQVLTNQNITLRISVLQSTMDGPEVYQEVHSVITSELGLVNIEVGHGKALTGSMPSIDWGSGSHFLRVEMDPAEGTDFEMMGVSQLLSVPYALYAEKAGSGDRTDDLDWQVIGSNVVTGHGGSYPTGNVGIGTSSPEFKLHINNGTSPSDLVSESTVSGTDGTIGRIRLKNSASGDLYNISLRKGGGNTELLQSAYDAGNATWREFIYFNYNTQKYEMRAGIGDAEYRNTGNILFNNSGNVGIGKNSPAEKLEVAGKIRSDQGFNIKGINGFNDTVNQITSFDFVNNKLKYRTYVYQGGLITFITEESDWVDTVDYFIYPVGNDPQPCPGEPSVLYEDKVYNTIQIGDQCWLKENLNVGLKINSTSGVYQQQDNDTIEKYCYGNDESNCTIYGGLYEWPEAMQYIISEGGQGICPAGWHIPTDNDFKVLEGTVDSQYGVGDPEWDKEQWRGYDAGGNLKEAGTSHWYSPNIGATNSSGFTGFPGGLRDFNEGSFANLTIEGYFWSSSGNTGSAWSLILNYLNADVNRNIGTKVNGFSVRCLKDTD